jgi:S1-C subfamily serine protease
MRKRLFAFLCALTLLIAAVPAASALSGEQTRAADTLYTLGLVNGTGGASGYALSGSASRAQAVSLLVRLAGAESMAEKGGHAAPFQDLPAWAKNDITYAYAMSWVSGTSETVFSPNRAVTADGFCAMLLRMLGYSDTEGDFTVVGAARFAQHIGLTAQDYTTGSFTRGDLFALAEDALTFCYKGSSETVVQRLVSRGAVSRASANALGLFNTELTARQAYDRCSAAVFQLNCYESQVLADAKTPSGNASGFFISADGLAVTNYHAIKNDIYATATLSTGETYKVDKVLYYDEAIDIAVLRISTTSTENVKTSGFAYLELAGTKDALRGDNVYTISNPLGLGLAISSGIISDPKRVLASYKLPCVMNTADISSGSSGGALLNVYGQVVAVTSGAYLYGNNMYLSVPVDPVLTADLSGAGQTLAEVAKLQAAADAEAKAAAAAAES